MTMPLDARLRDLLVCPQCKGGLAEVDGGQSLLCDRCKLRYPVRAGI
ncbi:MAG: Trm112 family protein, partial [bacterium]